MKGKENTQKNQGKMIEQQSYLSDFQLLVIYSIYLTQKIVKIVKVMDQSIRVRTINQSIRDQSIRER
jgi:hypothetical protein